MEKTYCLILRGSSPRAFRTAVEAAHVLGWLSVSMEFPVLRCSEEVPAGCIPIPVEDGTDWTSLREMLISGMPVSEALPDGYVSALDQKPAVPCPVPRGGLESMFARLTEDTDRDGLPDRVLARIELPAEMDAELCGAACDLAARLGLESCGLAPKILWDGRDDRVPRIRLTGAGAPSVRLARDKPMLIDVNGTGRELTDFTAEFCNRFSQCDPLSDLSDQTAYLADALAVGNGDGQLAWAVNHPGETFLLFTDADPERFRVLNPDSTWYRYADDAEPAVLDCPLPDETTVLQEKLEHLCAGIRTGDSVALRIALWKDRPEREALREEIQARLEAIGAAAEIRICCAYKQPVCWLEEDFAPRARQRGNVVKAEIRFSPALPGQPEGERKPPRTLMELYPADRLVADILGIGEDDVSILPTEEMRDWTYEALAYGKDGAVLYRDTFTLFPDAEPYLRDYPQAGQTFQPGGYFWAAVNGKTVCDERLFTDAHAVRDAFETRVLPWLRETLDRQEQLPLFSHLDLDISIGGPERRLDGTDLLSAGEAIDEYLTMAMNTWTRFYTSERFGHPVSGIGRLVPRIHVRPGAPEMKAFLFRCRGSAPEPRYPRPETICTGVEPGLWLTVRADGADGRQLDTLLALTAAGQTDLAERLRGCAGLTVNGRAAILPAADVSEPLSAAEIEWHENTLVGYSDYARLMAQLRRVSGLSVFRAGRSFQGRTVWAVTPAGNRKGYTSRTKLIQHYPTLIVNGRHHANEVSASNAILSLIRICTADPPKDVNLLMLPMENVDSAARHEELQKEHPSWQFHSCYENALNRDLILDYYHHDTIHTEALAFTRLAERWQPDAFADLHGVPHHEMPQLFGVCSGYKGLWIPRSMLYGFYFHVEDSRFPSNRDCNIAWSHAVNRAYAGWDTFEKINRRFEKRFQKYAWNGADELYPFSWEGNFLNYWPGSPQDERHPYLSVSRPWLLSVLFTAEAADETAGGDWLDLCRQAHLRHLRGGIAMLQRCTVPLKAGRDGEEWILTRHRPLIPAPEDLNAPPADSAGRDD